MSLVEKRTAVVLDRHPLWLEAVENVLVRLGVEITGKTTNPEKALELVEERPPDVFITSIAMDEGELNGLMCVRHLRDRAPSVRSIVLSMNSDPRTIEEALDAGAVAYVLKTAHADDLASAIRQAFDHSVFMAGSRGTVSTLRSANGDSPSAEAAPRQDTAGLTRREVEILRLVAEGHSNADLAKMLWVTEQTVKFHLSNVYRKLDVSNRTEASRWAQLNGVLAPVAAEAGVA
jgi:DNA-binding NarL/FixJ family response regulator